MLFISCIVKHDFLVGPVVSHLFFIVSGCNSHHSNFSLHRNTALKLPTAQK